MSDSNQNGGFLVPLPKTSTAIVIKELKSNPPNRGRNNEVILEEEEYLKNLEKVINKTFFPLLHAQQSNQPPEEHDALTHISGIDPSVVQNDVDRLSLNQYMAKYNSEDNASFEKLLDKDEENWQKKYWWIAKQAEDYRDRQLAIQASSENKVNNMLEGSKQPHLMLCSYEEQNNLMFAPVTKSKEIKSYSDPDSNEFKKISYENTRFDEGVLRQLNEKSQSRQSTSQPALSIDRLRTPNLLGLESNDFTVPYPKPVEPEKEQNIRGFNLLSMPSPSPNNQTPVMTWGEVEGTPVVLDSQRRFRMQETSRRDQLAADMPLELARRKKRTQTQQKQKIRDMLTPSPMRKESDLRRMSSVLSSSRKIRKDSTANVKKPAVITQNIKPSLIKSKETIDKEELMKSTKGLTDNLLHFK